MADRTRPVLIVDDDEDTRGFLTLTLRMLGLNVITARDGEEGLAMATAHHPCVILLDLMMPGVDGFAFRDAQLRSAELASTPVIVISAMTDRPQVHDRIGRVPTVPKPIDIHELIEHVMLYASR